MIKRGAPTRADELARMFALAPRATRELRARPDGAILLDTMKRAAECVDRTGCEDCRRMLDIVQAHILSTEPPAGNA